ncbi:MAG: hypothetical protein H7279_00100 [Microbacteriaceae bacterium]|nr:hypothetical protein [Microbacteriaceae bacterium]
MYAVILLTIEQLQLPSGPNFALLPAVVLIGFVLGLIMGLFAVVGVVPGILATRRSARLTTLERAVLVGLIAAATSFTGALLVFGHPYFVNWGLIVVATVSIVFLGVSTAVGICERRENPRFL